MSTSNDGRPGLPSCPAKSALNVVDTGRKLSATNSALDSSRGEGVAALLKPSPFVGKGSRSMSLPTGDLSGSGGGLLEVTMDKPGAFRLLLSCRSRGTDGIGGGSELDDLAASSEGESEYELDPLSESASTEGANEGTGTLWADCLRARWCGEAITGVIGATMSVDIEGTGGGDGGAFSLLLKSRMKPLFFRPIVRCEVPPNVEDASLGRGGGLWRSAVEADVKPRPGFPLLPLAERSLLQCVPE